MPVDPAAELSRRAFFDGAQHLADVAGRIPPTQWEAPGLGEWTVRELLGHTLRALTTVEQYLVTPEDPASGRIAGPGDYFRVGLGGGADVHAQVAARGRAAGEALGDDPAAAARAAIERVVALVSLTPDDAVCTTPTGRLRLADYLATRVVELAVHGLDLQRAIGEPSRLPGSTASVAVDVLAGLADRAGVAGREDLLLALTGRARLPDGYNVLD